MLLWSVPVESQVGVRMALLVDTVRQRVATSLRQTHQIAFAHLLAHDRRPGFWTIRHESLIHQSPNPSQRPGVPSFRALIFQGGGELVANRQWAFVTVRRPV